MKILWQCIFAVALSFQQLQAAIIITPLEKKYVATTIICDHAVTNEFFVPYYRRTFGDYDLGKNPEKYLAEELVADEVLFNQVAAGACEDTKVLIALDDETCVGLLIYTVHKDEKIIELELFEVLHSARGQGVGTKLFAELLRREPSMHAIVVKPFKNNNESTLGFYRKLGFIAYPYEDATIKRYGIARDILYTKLVLSLKRMPLSGGKEVVVRRTKRFGL